MKYTDLLKYILFKCYNKPNFGKTVLCSILYFIDFTPWMNDNCFVIYIDLRGIK